jgi:hypothetical protein
LNTNTPTNPNPTDKKTTASFLACGVKNQKSPTNPNKVGLVGLFWERGRKVAARQFDE